MLRKLGGPKAIANPQPWDKAYLSAALKVSYCMPCLIHQWHASCFLLACYCLLHLGLAISVVSACARLKEKEQACNDTMHPSMASLWPTQACLLGPYSTVVAEGHAA